MPDLRNTNANPPMPDWVKSYRPHQMVAVAEILDAFNRDVKVVMLDAPTGSGKTLIGEVVRRAMQDSSIYTCSTKTLQDQFVADFDYARVLKGRANYPTEYHPAAFFHEPATRISCEDCDGAECELCEGSFSCPYQLAKQRALSAPVAVLNTAYLLGEGNSGRSEFKGRGLAIVDEADLLEGALMSYAEVRIGPRAQKKYGITPPSKKTVKEDWAAWVNESLPKVRSALYREQEAKQRRRIRRLEANLTMLQRDLMDDERTDWVYTDYESGSIVFKPVQVDEVAKTQLWGLAQKWLLMSASLISGQQMADDLGLEDGEWEVVTVGNTFPKENRPVHIAPVASLGRKDYDAGMPKVQEALTRIIEEHPGENVLVHTVSYKLARDLGAGIPNTLTYTNAGDRERVLKRFRSEGGVILAPSLDRGVDLPGDLCTVQVIVKVPYPFLGDKQIQQRLYATRGGQTWYRVQTVRTLVQMTGRGVRSVDDTCTTYILDSGFLKLYREAAHLFPEWWREALDTTGDARRWIIGKQRVSG